MKLDKIRFARLISYLTEQDLRHGNRLTEIQIGSIDELVEFEVPQPEYKTPAKPIISPVLVDELLKQVASKNKIPAISAYRALTGASLVDAKNAVERYWHLQPAHPALAHIPDSVAFGN